jgi:hypothetical protein
MRLLFTVVHFFRGGAKGLRNYGSMNRDPAPRVQALTDCISALHEHFGGAQYALNHGQRTAFPANATLRHTIDVVVCTVPDMHLLGELKLPAGSFQHHLTKANPTLLGYECHAVLRERLGSYDFYCYLEDDLIIHDPLFFTKLSWFNKTAAPEDLLQPNRYEVALKGDVNKVYVDGALPPRSTAPFQQIAEKSGLKGTAMGQEFAFRRTLNPHSGAFFLSESQLRAWTAKPYFLDRSSAFIGPPESAATLGIMKTFRIYKPALRNAAFLELQHAGKSYLDLVGHKVPIAGRTTPSGPKQATRPAARQAKSRETGAAVESAVEEGLRNFDF